MTATSAPARSWARVGTGTPDTRTRRALVAGLARTTSTLVGATVAILVVWTAFVSLVDVSPFVAKTPLDVWRYLFTDPTAAASRAGIGAALVVTLGDAALGFGLGLVLAAAVTVLFHFFRTAEKMLTPTISALHAIPMVTVAPILVLIFGRGPFGVAVIGAAIVFVPAMLTMLQGIRSAPRTDLDMCAAFGGSSWSAFARVALPHAVPTWFAAARVAVTSSVVGALLAEWLASGEGLGGQMLRDANEFEFARLWASVVVLTVVCVLIYQLVGLLETFVTAQMGVTR
ncbi:Hydroxymethylpyrimidine ABC transporter, transmembrane component [Pseudonocardia sp. Ae406_Ps2]|uniref:ABC transporter permease n=1 Tax=unclassified Pseudonocardia TaxID=2619320 RepID=UPI0009610F30|nr:MULTISPECIES: ABC transporter permease subunit [unclassified Pseudonocardia]OLL98247.1 Hydroxymethylpyrimidine ABC transporter, transmembrane component [Pseudonocardia sp. Ae331_Ps2]OLM04042.1 Hydroxymethylpyrimidine ABC transporter, transmembrane component [Pseudonocardia sp. Ae406_Ps2]OLM11129.1 Hydroxymethylpyrimidine ABC transporter, transmembrane component [Pseudonocardia sp. Ae505_Ps2]OLM25590.1 Hydroxymethylpyrimidine ABC transporter, transmembrane component [Pseudonocardia sp. Ae706_